MPAPEFKSVQGEMAEALVRIARASEKLAGIGEAPKRVGTLPEQTWQSLPFGDWIWMTGFDVGDPDANWYFRLSSRRIEGGTTPPGTRLENDSNGR